MNIRHEKKENEIKIYLDGHLDHPGAKVLEEYLSDKYQNVWTMVVDFKNVDYTSSAGIRVLLKSELIMKTRGGLKLVNVNEEINRVLKISGFDKIFSIE